MVVSRITPPAIGDGVTGSIFYIPVDFDFAMWRHEISETENGEAKFCLELKEGEQVMA
jgi:hypothetical protein